MKRALLITNRRLDESVGRAKRLQTRSRILEDRGWEVVPAYVPQTRLSRILPAILSCARTARANDVDAVNSISSPFHLQLVGLGVSLLTRRPWLVEFRDPLVTNPNVEWGTVRWRARKVIEWLLVRFADAVVWTDGGQFEDDYFEETYSEAVAAKVTKLPFLGFDPDLFEKRTAANFEPFTVTYAGSFYEGWIEPYAFLEGLSEYVSTTEDPDLQVLFYGDWSDEYTAYARDLGVAEYVDPRGYVHHDELVPILKGSDAALYVGGTDVRNERSVPSKMWDYIGARTPVLAVVDPSFRVADLVRDEDFGVVAPPDDPAAVAAAIRTIRDGAAGRGLEDDAAVARFDRHRKISAFADVLDSLCPHCQ